MIVRLTQSELMTAGIQAVQRHVENLVMGRKDCYGAHNRNGLEAHFRGCMGEVALAKLTDRFWSGELGNLRAKDVGKKLQVRATKRGYGLVLHKPDKDDDIFVLGWVSGATVDFRGWLYAREGKLDEHWKKDGELGRDWTAAYCVPEDQIRPMPESYDRGDLREEFAGEFHVNQSSEANA